MNCEARFQRHISSGMIEATFTLAPVTGPFILNTGVRKKREAQIPVPVQAALSSVTPTVA